jgi:cytidine/deoxycytidylate deaminase-like protein
MQRRTLLHNLLSATVAMPVLAQATKALTPRSSVSDEDFVTRHSPIEAGDEDYIRRAIVLAGNVPKYPFGALLVDAKKKLVVAEGWNRSVKNPTWHGEMDAINNCSSAHPGIDWTTLTLYTTAEPCAMCQGAGLCPKSRSSTWQEVSTTTR